MITRTVLKIVQENKEKVNILQVYINTIDKLTTIAKKQRYVKELFNQQLITFGQAEILSKHIYNL